MNKQKFSQTQVVMVLFIIFLIGGAYYLGTLKNSNPTLSESSNSSKTAPTNISDICMSEESNILSVLSTFESLQQSKNSSGVLQLFTTPQLQQDKSDYQNLSGADANITPRLYNDVSTN